MVINKDPYSVSRYSRHHVEREKGEKNPAQLRRVSFKTGLVSVFRVVPDSCCS
jgi:hypothetical protein